MNTQPKSCRATDHFRQVYAILFVLFLLANHPSQAATYYWHPTSGGPGGNWDTSTTNWQINGTGSQVSYVDSSSNVALFNTAGAYTVTITSAPRTTGRLQVDAGDVTVNGAFTITGGADVDRVTTAAGASVKLLGSLTTTAPPNTNFYPSGSGTLYLGEITTLTTGGVYVLGSVVDLLKSDGSFNSSLYNAHPFVLQNQGQFSVLQSNGNFAPALGTGNGQTSWWFGSAGGFSARQGQLDVYIGGISTPTSFAFGGSTSSGSTTFVGAGNALDLNSPSANSQVVFHNNMNLNGVTQQEILVLDNPNSTSDLANIASVISNSTGTGGIVKTGAGTLILTGTNTYNGTTTVQQGTLVAGTNALASGNGAFGNSSGGAIVLGNANTTTNNYVVALQTGGVFVPSGTGAGLGTSTAGSFNVGRPVTISNNATSGGYSVGGSSDSNSTFSGLITTNQPLSITQIATTGSNALSITGGITSGNAGAKTLTFNNVGAVNVSTTAISDGGAGTLAVTQSGAGTTTFGVANTYTGGTSITGGTLLVNNTVSSTSGVGTGDVLINSGTLGGSGFVGLASDASNITFGANGGKIAPGNSPGILTVNGDVNFNIGGGTKTFEVELNGPTVGTGYDQLLISGSTAHAVDLNSSVLNAIFGTFDTAGVPLWIVNNTTTGTLSGVFSNFPTNGQVVSTFNGHRWQIFYNVDFATGNLTFGSGNDVVIIPEPGTFAMLFSGGLGLWLVRRKRTVS